jgi:hypothetical protein
MVLGLILGIAVAVAAVVVAAALIKSAIDANKNFSDNPVGCKTQPCPSAPTTDELRNNPTVQQAMEQAWTDSQPDDAAKRHEEGGWVYMNTTTGEITTQRAPAGKQASISVENPPAVSGSVVVATFHTHPNPTSEGWDPGPSDADTKNANRRGVPTLIRSDDGVHTTGPDTRRGGLSGGSGFPP